MNLWVNQDFKDLGFHAIKPYKERTCCGLGKEEDAEFGGGAGTCGRLDAAGISDTVVYVVAAVGVVVVCITIYSLMTRSRRKRREAVAQAGAGPPQQQVQVRPRAQAPRRRKAKGSECTGFASACLSFLQLTHACATPRHNNARFNQSAHQAARILSLDKRTRCANQRANVSSCARPDRLSRRRSLPTPGRHIRPRPRGCV